MDSNDSPVDSSRTPPTEKNDTTSQVKSEDLAKNISATTNAPLVPVADHERRNVNTKLANPLAEYSIPQLRKKGREYATSHGILEDEDIRAFELGAILAQKPEQYDRIKEDASADEMRTLEKEYSKRWDQPWTLYLVVILCSTCAAVQGMDETVVNGAQLFYSKHFGIGDKNSLRDHWLVGLTNGAPYLCCAFVGCWLTPVMNRYLGRKGTILVTCAISALTCFGQAFANSWQTMFIARFLLGLGIGPKSATVPIYAAETAPPSIRGALVMQWQMWTAFGIMLGYVAGVALFKVPDVPGIVGLNWRLMMASAMLPAIVVCLFVHKCPESPRWYMSKNKHIKAYISMCSLRHIKIQAARDQFYMAELLKTEQQLSKGRNKLLELFTVPRNRRAMVASEIVMFMQQFCGVNIIAYYSSTIFHESGFSDLSALSASLGFGVINFLFAIPAIYTIDTFGRRNLLLTTFPLMALALLYTGFSFYIPDTHRKARIGNVATGIYLFGMVYSPGEGPVPFTYSAEAYPLDVRAIGMSLATATTWFFNFVLAITWPIMSKTFTPQGAFGWYATWNIIGWWLVLLFLPETKGKTLEELDQVFNIPTRVHTMYGLKQVGYFWKGYILRQDVKPVVLYEVESINEKVGGREEVAI